jgi:hypothetical protein
LSPAEEKERKERKWINESVSPKRAPVRHPVGLPF